jgi:GT2 family glycosyltransferase
MDATSQLDILILNFNGKAMLRNLLASIESTRGDLNVRTIIFDNASSDGSVEMVTAEFPRVILGKSEINLGFARGNNRAARLAAETGQPASLLLLLNNDTVIRPDALRKLIDLFDRRPEIVAAGPKLIGGDGKTQHTVRGLPGVGSLLHTVHLLKWTHIFARTYRRYRYPDLDLTTEIKVAHLPAAALAVRRTAFEKCGGFDEGFPFGIEDLDLCHRLGQLGPIYYLPDAQIEHLGRISSRANRGFVYSGYECGWARYLHKHHGKGAAMLYKILVTLDMPVRLVVLALQWMMQTVSGRKEKAKRTRDVLGAAAQFTFGGLPAFWKA